MVFSFCSGSLVIFINLTYLVNWGNTWDGDWNTNIKPASRYFVELDLRVSNDLIWIPRGLYGEGNPVVFQKDKFFEVFPRIITKYNYELSLHAASYNKRYSKNTGFVQAEIWWKIEWREVTDKKTLKKAMEEVVEINKIYPGTVTTCYFRIFSEGFCSSIVQSVKKKIHPAVLLINQTSSLYPRIAVELRYDFDCSSNGCVNCSDIENIMLSFPSLVTITVGINSKLSGYMLSYDKILKCHKYLITKTNGTSAALLPKGDVGGVSKLYHILYRGEQLKISCTLEYVCTFLQGFHSYIKDSPNYFLIYELDVEDAGIVQHPERLVCGAQNSSESLWTDTGLNQRMGFSIFFDSKSISYTADMLFALAKTSPNLLIENRYVLNNSTQKKFYNFTATLMQMLEIYREDFNVLASRRSVPLRSVLFRISFTYPSIVEAPVPDEFNKWATLVESISSKINELRPSLIEGVVFRENSEASYGPDEWFEKISLLKRNLQWKSGIKLGFQHVYYGYRDEYCPVWLNISKNFDLTMLEFRVDLRQQCLSAFQSELQEEIFGNLLSCNESKIYLETFPSNKLALYVQIEKCKADADPETDSQYELIINRLNQLSVLYNTNIYIGFAVQEPSEYYNDDYIQFPESCGWWYVKENVSKLAYLQSRRPGKENFRRADSLNVQDLRWLWILLAVSAICAVAVGISFIFVMNYRRKYLLQYEEIKSFFHGQIPPCNSDNAFENAEALASKHDKERLEVLKAHFSIDSSKSLGSGEFGMVHLGTIDKGDNTITVAVKTTKQSSRLPGRADPAAIRGLVSEIKLLSYIGDHNNIVRLLGAYTENLKRGYVAVFLEYCANGSLLDFLRNCKSKSLTKSNMDTDNSTLSSNIQEKLLTWSYEIVNGMDYLSSKKVVHSDLAARNTLLDSAFVAKISDFGLSRRLYNSTNYVKSRQEPLPWQWMAPEALRNLVFNEKTDVWAYGVTLWEIYTLGDVPYPNLTWDDTFSNKLISGLRLPIPSNAESKLFSLVSKCWCNNPDSRPTFAFIKLELENKLGRKIFTDPSYRESDTENTTEVRDG